jgi:membrane associated rhomboid family serine protease
VSAPNRALEEPPVSTARSVRTFFTFGGRMPPVVGALIAVTVALSLASSPALRFGDRLLELGLLVPGEVLRGQVWRVVTWAFFAARPLELVFGCLCLYWFARDLVAGWGEWRFLAVYLGVAATAGLLLTAAMPLVGGAPAMGLPFSGVNACALVAMVLLWALLNPTRQINFYFVFPMQGRVLALITVGATVLFALWNGVAAMMPEFAAEAAALGYLYAWLPLERAARRARKPRPRRPPTSFQVWDDKKQQFRPPKWMN